MSATVFDFDAVTVSATPKKELAKRSIFELNRLDALAREMERKWGVGRLPLLVADDLADRFFSQHRKTSIALRSPDPKQAITEIGRMVNAWKRLDAEAERLGAPALRPFVIEAMAKDGTVIAIVRDFDEAGVVQTDGRTVKVYAASEIARLIEAMPTIASIKEIFRGARVKETRFDTSDRFWEHGDEIPF
jgi:hypothetical protein